MKFAGNRCAETPSAASWREDWNWCTRFAYSDPRVSEARIGLDGSVTVSVTVKNTGERDGEEVVALYLTHPGVPGAPILSLE